SLPEDAKDRSLSSKNAGDTHPHAAPAAKPQKYQNGGAEPCLASRFGKTARGTDIERPQCLRECIVIFWLIDGAQQQCIQCHWPEASWLESSRRLLCRRRNPENSSQRFQ